MVPSPMAPLWPQHQPSDTCWGANWARVYSVAHRDAGGGGDTPTSGLGWMSPPPHCCSHPRVAPRAPNLGLFSTACHISSPCPCCAVCASPGGAWLEELVLGSLLGGGFLSPWPPSAPSSSAAAGPGSSTISHPGTGNGASLASPSSSPWVRMFLEITVGTGDAGVGSTGVGWGELQLVPLP